MSVHKKQVRQRRAQKSRAKIKRLGRQRLCVHRTPRHTYAQVISGNSANVLVSVSTVDKEVRDQIKNGGNIEAAAMIGELLAKRAKDVGISAVAFDRSGFKYHGRIKALAEAARSQGMKF